MSSWLGLAAAMALTIAAGAGLVLQQALNADLKVSLGSVAWAGFVSYLGGTLCMLVLVFIARDAIPGASAIARSNWFSWTGGFFGAVYIALGVVLLQRLGAATFISLLIAGQMLCSLTFDHFGLFGIPQHPVDATRIVGVALLIAGVFLIRL